MTFDRRAGGLDCEGIDAADIFKNLQAEFRRRKTFFTETSPGCDPEALANVVRPAQDSRCR